MCQFLGPEDIYEELVEKQPDDEDWLLGLVAFAIIEEQKIEWIKHQTKNNGSPPTDDEIKKWYQQQPSGVLLRAKDTALSRLTNYGENVISQYNLDYQKEVEESIIVSEIRDIKRFWPQFGVNFAGGFASAVIFAALLVLVAFFVINDTSPVKIGEKIGNKTENISNGQEK